MRTLFFAMTFVMTLLVNSVSYADQEPRFGKVICEAVSHSDALQFAQNSHFLDNWDYLHQKLPPYTAPVGTLACTLPVEYTSDTDVEGHTFYTLYSPFRLEPFHLKACTVTYYDQRHSRHFKADGEGRGYVDLVPGTNDFAVFFYDNDQTKYQSDEFLATQIGRDRQIVWMGETQDDRSHVPIVSNCHVEL
jgi:hypothetical protein